MDGDTSALVKKPVISTIQDYYDDTVHLPVFSPDELLGMTVLRTVDDETVCDKVVRKILDRDADNHSKIKFLLSLGDGQLEEIILYNKLSGMVEAQESKESGQWELLTYAAIHDHQGPLKPHDPKYHGSLYHVLVSWDNGTQTWEALNLMAKQDPVTLVKYAQEHDLLNMLG